ncbi:hypothetical protein B5807_10051 [Epicoccum nigrum]|uniref:Uncharacterized protein n=1 Tax=Epicoccum nigrum TaxID=105696 RepID=A0A1Y2LTS2_EPING|nr:hypothetical protein B5807_10051 [Epicoccum nigrum]
MDCLVCGKDIRLCKGNFENFLSREEPEHWKMDNRSLGITSILPKIAKSDLRLLVTYHHTNPEYLPITLHKAGETLDATSWYDKLVGYKSEVIQQAKNACGHLCTGTDHCECDECSDGPLMRSVGFFCRANSETYTEGDSDFQAAFDKYDSSDFDGSESESDDSDLEGSIGSESMSDL